MVGAVLLAGCTGGATPHATVTRTVTPSPTATATSTATATASDRPSPSESGAPSTPGGSSASESLCATAVLKGIVGERNGAPPGTGSGMNQQHVAIILTNTGTTTCTLQGWPGVSLVGKGDGTQLGAAATLDRSTPHPTLTIKPGGKVQAPLDYENASAYPPAECRATDADGLRVYPPASRTSLFISDKLQACTLTTHDLLRVGAFVAYP